MDVEGLYDDIKNWDGERKGSEGERTGEVNQWKQH